MNIKLQASPSDVGELPKPPGMHDVARAAGVSHQTVSRVLNDHPNVRTETKERVMRAIADLGYRRNTAARALVTRRSGIIGVVTPRSALFGPTSTLIAVEAAAREAGYFVSLASVASSSPAVMTAALEHFMDQAVEGLVVVAPARDLAEAASVVASRVPMVMISAGTPDGEGFRTASVDNEMGARKLTRHLLEAGHRDVAHVSGPEDALESAARVRGWAAELKAAGLPVPEPYLGDWSPERGYEVGREMLQRGLPTAVFAANDHLALGVIRALTEAGVRVPEDVSVVGFDDVTGSAFFNPPLTTLKQDFSALGKRCIEMLSGIMRGEEVENSLIPPVLVVRASTAPPSERSADTARKA